MGNQRYLECARKGALTSVHAQGHGADGHWGRSKRWKTPGEVFRRLLTANQSQEVSVHCSRNKGMAGGKVCIILTATAAKVF